MNFVLYFRSMNIKSLIIILIFFGLQAEARLADFEFKNCDNIHRDSLGDLVLFAYKEDIANFPLGKDSMSRDNQFRDDKKNKYPQVGQLKIPFIRSDGSKSTGTAFFVKNGSGRRTLRTAAHDFINAKTGKLYGPLDEYDFELGGHKYGIESIRCGADVAKNLENLYLDQCEVTLKEDIVDGIDPLELDYDFLKNNRELTAFGDKIRPILKPFQDQVYALDQEINKLLKELIPLKESIEYLKSEQNSDLLSDLKRERSDIEEEIEKLKDIRKGPLSKIEENFEDANNKFGMELVGFHGYPPNWRGFRSINQCGYVYDRDGQNEFFAAQCNSSAGMSGSPLIHNGKAVGIVVSAGQPNVDNAVIAPLPVEQLNIVINHDNEKDFL